MGLEVAQVVGHHDEELTAFAGGQMRQCEGGSVGLARLHHQGAIERKEGLLPLRVTMRQVACDVH